MWICLHSRNAQKQLAWMSLNIFSAESMTCTCMSLFLDCGKATHVGKIMSDFKRIVVVGKCICNNFHESSSWHNSSLPGSSLLSPEKAPWVQLVTCLPGWGDTHTKRLLMLIRKFELSPLNETNLGVAQALFGPWRYHFKQNGLDYQQPFRKRTCSYMY